MTESLGDDPQENRGLSGRYGILSRIHAGKAALSLAAVEIPTGVASVLLDDTIPFIASTLISIWTAGETIYDFYNNRNYTSDNLMHRFSRWLAKDPQEQ
jgi:hypothetical protein